MLFLFSLAPYQQAVVLWVLPNEKTCKLVSLNASVLLFIFSQWFILSYYRNGFNIVLGLDFGWFNGFLLDAVSVYLVALTSLLTIICIISSWSVFLGY